MEDKKQSNDHHNGSINKKQAQPDDSVHEYESSNSREPNELQDDSNSHEGEDQSLKQSDSMVNDSKQEEDDDEYGWNKNASARETGFADEENNMMEEDEPYDEQDGHEDDEEEHSSAFRQPIIDSRNITFRTKILNEHLLCALCMGYFRDAHTIIECLHTFCKSCIYKYFREKSDCPHCSIYLGTYPYGKIKFDRQIQNIVDKIFPHLIKEDAEAEREFYKSRGIEMPEQPEPKAEDDDKDASQPAKKLKKGDIGHKKFYADEVSFELLLDESDADGALKKLDKPFIRTSAKVTVKHLKKYLISKLKMDMKNLKELDITYRGEVLGNEHSLEYILKIRGVDASTKNPVFKYKKKKDLGFIS